MNSPFKPRQPMCRQCRYFSVDIRGESFAGIGNVEHGECRRRQPSANFTEYSQRERSFPLVRAGDWCGEHEAMDG